MEKSYYFLVLCFGGSGCIEVILKLLILSHGLYHIVGVFSSGIGLVLSVIWLFSMLKPNLYDQFV